MTVSEKDLRLIRKGFENKNERNIDKIRIDLEPTRRMEMMERSGRRTVPQIYVDDYHVGGFDDLSALNRAGKLDPILDPILGR